MTVAAAMEGDESPAGRVIGRGPVAGGRVDWAMQARQGAGIDEVGTGQDWAASAAPEGWRVISCGGYELGAEDEMMGCRGCRAVLRASRLARSTLMLIGRGSQQVGLVSSWSCAGCANDVGSSLE